MVKSTNIDVLTIVELKALAYDQIIQIEQNQMNLKTINSKIAEKIKEESNILTEDK